MSLRDEKVIENKIKTLEEKLNISEKYVRYNIRNEPMKPSYMDNIMDNVISSAVRNQTQAKIDALKWALKKKRLL